MVPIDSLPLELLIEILARVAASSSIELGNAKLSCKAFLEAAEDKLVYRRVSLDNIYAREWVWHKNGKSFSLINKCMDSGNPEALYRQGAIECFGNNLAVKKEFYHLSDTLILKSAHEREKQVESGLQYLKMAAKSEHLGASYLLGVIFVSSKDKEIQRQGKELLSKTNGRRRECRQQLQSLLRNIKWNFGMNHSLINGRPLYCTKPINAHKIKRIGWVTDSDDETDVHCKGCEWDLALDSFECVLSRV